MIRRREKGDRNTEKLQQYPLPSALADGHIEKEKTKYKCRTQKII
jgi:hypothetical protein